jgi:hypothetical protein
MHTVEQKVHGTNKKGSLEYRSKTPGGAGYTRQTHEPHKHLKTNPTLRLTRLQTTPEPRNARVATNHRSPLTRSSALVVTDIRTLALLLLCVNRVNVNTTDATAGATALLLPCVNGSHGVFLPVVVSMYRYCTVRRNPARGLSPRWHPARLTCQRHYLCRLEHGLTIWSHGQLRILPARCRARSATSHSGACIATTQGACGLLFQRSHGATAGLRQSKQANIRCTVSAFSYWRMTCLAAGSGSMHVSCPWQC